MSNDEFLVKATEFFNNKEYSRAVDLLLKSAEAGNTEAMIFIAYMYSKGYGVSKDNIQEFKWYEKAANAGNLNAMFSLGLMYENGEGIEKDYLQAIKWYEKAAKLGNPTAMTSLGNMFDFGYGISEDYMIKAGVSRDSNQAIMWFQKAIKCLEKQAEDGDTEIMCNLANIYLIGFGHNVLINSQEAIMWYERAAEAGNINAMCWMGKKYINSEDFPEGINWYRKASELGCEEAMIKLGEMGAMGEGVNEGSNEEMNTFRIVYHLRKVAGDVYADEMWNISDDPTYTELQKEGIEKEHQNTMKWYLKKAEAGDIEAMILLGAMYNQGYGVTKDYSISIQWYKKASDLGSHLANKKLKELGY